MSDMTLKDWQDWAAEHGCEITLRFWNPVAMTSFYLPLGAMPMDIADVLRAKAEKKRAKVREKQEQQKGYALKKADRLDAIADMLEGGE